MCQVEPIGSSWMIVVWSCWKRHKLCAHENNCQNSPERDEMLIIFVEDQYTNYPGFSSFS